MSYERGTLHPITQYLRRSIAVFKELGFTVLDSPEVATEKNNFDDLLMPKDHSARELQDTFWLKTDDGVKNAQRRLPRTQTSAFQIPSMKNAKAPVRFLIPGRVFRNEATDATHETSFNQLEGFVIDEQTDMSHLKGMLSSFIQKLYGSDTEVRFVPAYFTFVEPGIEIYMRGQRGWLEMGGAGMIHPGVLKNMGVDSEKYQGFAFGMGVDRLVALAWGIEDIRHFHSGNLRFLSQFRNETEGV